MATQNLLNGGLMPDNSNGSLHNNTNSPVAVHSFDPDASPAQKAAIAGKDKEKLNDIRTQPEGQGGKEIALDAGHSNVVPTIMVEDADTHPVPNGHHIIRDPEPSAPLTPPGGMPNGLAPEVPDWFKVGWRAASGIDRPPAEDEEKQKNILDMFLAEQYYGTWYHNAALICFAVFTSHFLTRFHFGWGWLFIVLAVCNTYYTTSMVRVRRCARDDVQRELVKSRLASEHESAEWINNFLDRFWLIYEPVLSQTIVSSVDQILSTNTPAFLDSIRMATFTLGTKAPRIDRVRTFPKTAEDIVMMDWGISFTPNDVSDMTPRQAAKKVNPKIVLSVRVGKGIVASMPILLEDISFSGMMRIRMKLMTNFPHVQVVDICFLEPPVIDYVLKPLGGETFGFDIANIPGLSGFIREMTHATLGPMMYDPNVFTLNLEQLLSGVPLDTAIGVLQVTIDSARGIKGSKIGGGTPDPFVALSINNREELAHTKYKHNTNNPTWMETKFLIINSLTETLTLNLFDYNEVRKNTLMGSTSFELSKLNEDATHEGIESSILKDGKERGLLRYDVSFYPVLKAQSIEGKEELPETTVGIVRLTIHQAKDLDSSKSLSGDLNPIAMVHLGDSPTPAHTSNRMKHTNNPIWESATEFLCSDKASSVLTVKVIDDREFMKDPMVGFMNIRLHDLLNATAGRDWWPLSGCKSGKLRLSAEWKPLAMAGSLQGADKYTPPIGVVRLWLNKATDVKNVEAALGGKSDPYMRVQVNNVTKGRTEVVNNNLNPIWDQFIYIPVHSLKETLFMECMDYQHLTKDRSLGSIELRVSDLAKESDDPKYPYAGTGIKESADLLCLDNVRKGKLHYVAQFVPAVALQGVKFDTRMNEIQRAAEGQHVADNGSASSTSSVTSLTAPDTAVPAGITAKHPEGTFEKRHGRSDTIDTTTTVDSVRTAATSSSKVEPPEERLVHMTKEELLQQQSGIIVFNVTSGQLAKKARLEVLLDDGYWPAFTTIKARSVQAQWEHVGEGFLKELDFGRVWLRLNENGEGDKESIIAEWKGDAKPFLESTLDGPKTYTLMDEEEAHVSTVEIESRYVPVPVKLDPRETINNQGILRVDLIDGREIRGVDRGGKSDPFAVFSLNGQKVFKSQTKKKTLTPDWKENFIVSVPSRVKAEFSVEIFDWNQIEQAKSLGTASIDVADLEPFQASERVLNLVTAKHGEKGQIRVRLMFQPEIIAKSRKNTSTFSAAGRAMTTIGSLPVGAGKGVIHGVTGVFKKEFGKSQPEEDSILPLPGNPTAQPNGSSDNLKSVMQGVSGVFKMDFGKNHREEDGQPPVPGRPTGQASQPLGPSDSGKGDEVVALHAMTAQATGNDNAGPSEPGTLKVTILNAKDLSSSDVKPYVVVRVGGEERKTKQVYKTATPEWNESFNFPASGLTPKLFVWIFDHKTLGKDKVMGEAEIDIWRHLQPAAITSAEVTSELRQGQGLLRLRLDFDADSNVPRGTSVSSMERTQSMASPSRFSLGRNRRPGPDKDDDRD